MLPNYLSNFEISDESYVGNIFDRNFVVGNVIWKPYYLGNKFIKLESRFNLGTSFYISMNNCMFPTKP